MPKQTILLTGGTGFLGRNLLKRLHSDSWPVVLLKRSTSDTSLIQELLPKLEAMYDLDKTPISRIFEEQKVGAVVHCATNYGRKNEQPSQVIEANLLLPLTLLQKCREHGVRGFINSDTILDKRINTYSLSKRQFVEWMPHFAGNLVCSNMALEHFYGPWDDPTKFVTRVIQDLLDGKPSIDLTEGRQKRDFVFISDVVDAYLKVIEFTLSSPPGNFRFEVGTGNSISIRDFVTRVKELTGNSKTQLNFGALPYRENEVMETQTQTDSIRALGWSALTTLEQGLRRTIEEERKSR